MRKLGYAALVQMVASAAAGVLVTACATMAPPVYAGPPSVIDFRAVPSGVVETPGVTIAAMDGSVVLGSEPFAPPFDQGGGCVAQPMAEDSMSGVATGARRVKLALPNELAAAAGGKQEIYGLLSLCGAPPNARGAATRAYALQVPIARLQQLEGGRVSVAYEKFLWDDGGDHAGVAWILWLSTLPFPESNGVHSPTTAEAYNNIVGVVVR